MTHIHRTPLARTGAFVRAAFGSQAVNAGGAPPG